MHPCYPSDAYFDYRPDPCPIPSYSYTRANGDSPSNRHNVTRCYTRANGDANLYTRTVAQYGSDHYIWSNTHKTTRISRTFIHRPHRDHRRCGDTGGSSRDARTAPAGTLGPSFSCPGTGMLFIFEEPMPLQFWMKRMQFPLDFVWIGTDCTIGEITRDVPPPPPGTDDSDLARISPQGDMQYVLEINVGEASELGLEPGQVVVFAGSIDGRFGC